MKLDGACSFTLQPDEVDWNTNDVEYRWGISDGTNVVTATKTPDGKLLVKLKAPGFPEVDIESAIPSPSKRGGVGLVLLWSPNEGVRLTLGGKIKNCVPWPQPREPLHPKGDGH